MNSTPPYPPHWDIKARFSNNDYRNVCDVYGGGPEFEPRWEALGQLLAYRLGWHFEVVNRGDAIWSLGAFRTSILNVSPDPNGPGFGCYDHRSGSAYTFSSIDDVRQWIENNEEDARRAENAGVELLRSGNWKVLKEYEFDVVVSAENGARFVASIEDIPGDVFFAQDLLEVLGMARDQIVAYVDAPVELSSAIRLALHLNSSATALLGEGRPR